MARLAILIHVLALISSSLLIPIEKKVPKAPRADGVDYRLPDLVIPRSYAIDLTLPTNGFDDTTFTGIVTITLDIKEGSKTKQIVLHGKDLTIPLDKVTLVKPGTNGGEDVPIELVPPANGYVSDPATDKITINTNNVDLDGATGYLLKIEYTGVLSETAMAGFYKSQYTEGGQVKYLATTQFEQGDARRAFPSFDEPSFKAEFTVSITKPIGLTAISNTPQVGENPERVNDDLDKVTFEKTPKMSSYLLAFTVSEFTCSDGDPTDQGVPTKLCSRPESKSTRDLAVGVAPKVLNVMKTYTNFGYKDSNIMKMTQVAIPDFAAGAMENWGLVTYRERDLLWDKDQSSNRYQQSIVAVIAHEFSHQWFGDLVTLGWWSDVFLNEGFASYFEYHAPSKIPEYASWDMPQQMVVEELQTALQSDSSTTSVALSSTVNNLDEAGNKFDDIAYNKGGSIFRMVHHFMTEDKFKQGLAAYMDTNKYGNTVPEDLWEALSPFATELPGTLNLQDVMKNWIHEAGYPLLTVTDDGEGIKISQVRFLNSGEMNTKWYVPISYTVSTDTSEQAAATTAKAWLTPDAELPIADVLTGVDWIVLNNRQTGYYRIDYSDNLWKKLETALKKTDFSGIHQSNRAQIADDLLSMARADKKAYDKVFDQLSFLENDVDYYPWYAAFRGFSLLLRRVSNAKLRDSLMNYIVNLSAKLYKSTPFETEKPTDQLYTLNQVQSLTWACNLGVEDCITKAKAQFVDYRDNDKRPSRNLRTVVYCNGLKYSDDIQKDWQFLYNKFTSEQLSTEQVTIINALGCTTDVTTLNGYLDKIITPTGGIRMQDASTAFSSVYSNSQEGVEATLDFIIDKNAEIVAYFESSYTLISLINNVAERFTTQAQIDKLTDFVGTEGLDASVKAAGEKAITNAKNNQAFTDRFERQISNFFGSSSRITVSLGVFSATLLLLFTQYL